MPTPTDRGHPGRRGDAAGHAVQPRTHRVDDPERPAPTRQDEEGGLEGILGFMLVAEHGPANPQDHRSVPLDQDGEGQLSRLAASRHEAIEELAVGECAKCPDAEERLERPQCGAVSSCRHESVLRRSARLGLRIVMSRRRSSGLTIREKIRADRSVSVRSPAARAVSAERLQRVAGAEGLSPPADLPSPCRPGGRSRSGRAAPRGRRGRWWSSLSMLAHPYIFAVADACHLPDLSRELVGEAVEVGFSDGTDVVLARERAISLK